MNFKKLASLSTALLLAVSMTACTFGNSTANGDKNNITIIQQATIDPAKPDIDNADIQVVTPDVDPEIDEVDTEGFIHGYEAQIFERENYNCTEEDTIAACDAFLSYMLTWADENDNDYLSLRYNIIGLDCSGMPILAYATDLSHAAGVNLCRYNPDTKKVEELGEYGQYGTLYFYPSLNMIQYYGTGMGYFFTEYAYFDENYELQSFIIFDDNLSMAEYESYDEEDEYVFVPECRINGVEVDEDTYLEYLDSWTQEFDSNRATLYYEDMLPIEGYYLEYPMYTFEYEDYQIEAAVDAYSNLISGYADDENWRYTLVNICNSYIPTLVLSEGYEMYLLQYEPYEGKLTDVSTLFVRGSFQYDEGNNLIYSSTAGNGYYYWDVQRMDSYRGIQFIAGFTNEIDSYGVNGCATTSEGFYNYMKSTFDTSNLAVLSYDDMSSDFSKKEVKKLLEEANYTKQHLYN